MDTNQNAKNARGKLSESFSTTFSTYTESRKDTSMSDQDAVMAVYQYELNRNLQSYSSAADGTARKSAGSSEIRSARGQSARSEKDSYQPYSSNEKETHERTTKYYAEDNLSDSSGYIFPSKNKEETAFYNIEEYGKIIKLLFFVAIQPILLQPRLSFASASLEDGLSGNDGMATLSHNIMTTAASMMSFISSLDLTKYLPSSLQTNTSAVAIFVTAVIAVAAAAAGGLKANFNWEEVRSSIVVTYLVSHCKHAIPLLYPQFMYCKLSNMIYF